MISRRRNRGRPAVFVVTGILLSAVGCAREQPAATPANITAADLKKLSWIEGTWRGTGDGTAPFYERYRFQNDDTLVVEELADTGAVKRTTRYELKAGRFGSDRSVAIEATDSSITFDRGANTFRWQKESADVWTAVLSVPATEKTLASQRVYRLERWTAQKQ